MPCAAHSTAQPLSTAVVVMVGAADNPAMVWLTAVQEQSTPPRRHVLAVRPHALRFLGRLILAHELDTDRVEVKVSLFTRRQRTYCEAVTSHIFEPALSLLQQTMTSASAVHPPHMAASEAKRASPFFCHLLSNEHCTLGSECVASSVSQDCHPSVSLPLEKEGKGRFHHPTTRGACSDHPTIPTPLCRSQFRGPLRKSVGVTGCPWSSLLLDNDETNFFINEFRTGHGVLVPPFLETTHQQAELTNGGGDGDDDDVFYWPSEAVLSSSGDVEGDTRTAAGAAAPPPSSLVEVVHRFVQSCHTLADVMTRHSREAARTSGRVTVEDVNLLAEDPRVSDYQWAWNRHHGPLEDRVTPLLVSEP